MNCCWYTFIFSIIAVILLVALPATGIVLAVWAAIMLLVLIG